MTPEDKLEKYFKSVLEDKKLSEEEWAIPSEDLWESAKVHFPKKKKKDKAILFWWGLGACCFLAIGGLATILFQNISLPQEQLIGDNHFEKELSIDRKEFKQAKAKINPNNITISKEVAIEKTKIEEGISPFIKNLDSIEKLENEPYNKDQQKLNKNNPIIFESIAAKKRKRDNRLEAAQYRIEKEQIEIPKRPRSKQGLLKSIPVLSRLTKPIAILEIAERPMELQATLPVLTTPVQPTRNKWEIGLSYSPFVLIQESILNKGSESNVQDVSIGVRHQNINTSIRRFIHPRFSISSGLYLSKGSIDLAFCDTITYGQNKSISFRSFLKESDAVNEITSDSGIELDNVIEYLADANLSAGDELSIKGNIPFKLKFVQIPILFNTHFGKGKFKGIIHAGFSVDYQQLQANELTLEVFKANELISKPIMTKPLNEHTFHLRWQAGVGLRYAIKDFLQVGSAIHINVSEPILSRYDFGVYYGF